MKRLVRFIAALGIAVASPFGWGQSVVPPSEGMQLLQRVVAAAQKISYSGTFVYRNGSQSETSRILHVAGNGQQTEKLEVLDGSPREVIRHNDEVSCYLPESRLVIVEQRSARRTFPALLPVSIAGLGDHYLIRKAGNARVAGFDSQVIRLEPRDGWRYGHQLWVENATGLLLKAEINDERGAPLESMAFTELRLGEPQRADEIKPSFAAAARNGWQIRQARLREMRDDGPWMFRGDLPGFRRESAMRRILPAEGETEPSEILHWVYSDGLVSLSVFISPLRKGEAVEEGVQSFGALSVMKRHVEGHKVVVMGDMPAAAIKRFAEGVGVRSK